MFVDEVTMQLKAGDGGHGCLSFRRAKYEPKGGPNGGNGGKGGDIILIGDENTADLTDYKFVPHARAQSGENGRGSDQIGAMGANKVLRMPLGTIIINEETDEVVGELIAHGQEILLLQGGRGGVGNRVFKSSVNQAPRQTTAGKKGGEGRYRLVLKTIADLGLVGFPNAGKSSLTGLLTANKPKVGHYPFTTLRPSIGVIDYPDHYQRLTLADIPGLIEGAHENRGLGHRFLRHIERCKHLLFLIDMAGEDGRDPLDDFAQLLEELGHYDASLLQKPRLVLANKIDEPAALENIKRFKKRFRKEPLLPISCLSEEGIAELKETLRQKLAALPKVTTPAGTVTAAPEAVAITSGTTAATGADTAPAASKADSATAPAGAGKTPAAKPRRTAVKSAARKSATAKDTPAKDTATKDTAAKTTAKKTTAPRKAPTRRKTPTGTDAAASPADIASSADTDAAGTADTDAAAAATTAATRPTKAATARKTGRPPAPAQE